MTNNNTNIDFWKTGAGIEANMFYNTPCVTSDAVLPCVAKASSSCKGRIPGLTLRIYQEIMWVKSACPTRFKTKLTING